MVYGRHAELAESLLLLKEMNDCVFVFELLGKEFMRMANSVSSKFMTWPGISVAPCFVMLVFFFFVCEAYKMNSRGCVNNTSLLLH